MVTVRIDRLIVFAPFLYLLHFDPNAGGGVCRRLLLHFFDRYHEYGLHIIQPPVYLIVQFHKLGITAFLQFLVVFEYVLDIPVLPHLMHHVQMRLRTDRLARIAFIAAGKVFAVLLYEIPVYGVFGRKPFVQPLCQQYQIPTAGGVPQHETRLSFLLPFLRRIGPFFRLALQIPSYSLVSGKYVLLEFPCVRYSVAGFRGNVYSIAQYTVFC